MMEHPSCPPQNKKRMMEHPNVHFSYDLLKQITNDFSEECKIGSGSYGRVYKGVHEDGKTIAVKLLYDMPGLDDEQFKRELNNLTSLQHDNIVRLVGYCHETRRECAEYNGRPVVADRIRRALCFEYAYNGSLHDNLSDEYNGHDWGTRYGIIKGICNGLKYLHQDENMYHLDIKPANILLDENMLPKIADFGLSRLFGQEQTKITKSSIGTHGYLPPEYIEQNVISNKFDIFSLGVVIIKVIAGPKGYFRCADMSSREFVNLVSENWMKRLQAMSGVYSSHETDILQVNRCTEIALRCVEKDRQKRPCVRDIAHELEKLEAEIKTIPLASDQSKDLTAQIRCDSNIVSVDPCPELRFIFEPMKKGSCIVQITNKTDNFIALNLKVDQYKFRLQPSQCTMPPCSKRYISVTMEPQPYISMTTHCKDRLAIQSTFISEDLASEKGVIDYQELFETAMVLSIIQLPIKYVTL